MRNAALLTTVFAAAALVASVTFGQSLRRDAHSGQRGAPASINQAHNEQSPLEQKREWLRAQMLQEFSDIDRRAEINAKVDQMPAERIDALAKIYQKRDPGVQQETQQEARRQLAAAQARRDYLTQEYRNRLAAARSGGRSVGYAPVITWLPEGTSLGASAVVSPDRRYVRMSLQPFFSSVDRVDTFNFHTGQTRTQYPSYNQNRPSYNQHRPSFEQNPNYYNGARIYPRRTQQRPVRTYHDGLRTRTVPARRP